MVNKFSGITTEVAGVPPASEIRESPMHSNAHHISIQCSRLGFKTCFSNTKNKNKTCLSKTKTLRFQDQDRDQGL